MRLDSVRDLKQDLLHNVITPFTVVAAPRATPRTLAVPVLFDALGASQSLCVGAQPVSEVPTVQRSVALGVVRRGSDYRLAVRVQRPALLASPLVQHIVQEAKGEADVRMIGRIDKRSNRTRKRSAPPVAAKAVADTAVVVPTRPWYRTNARPLLIGSSIGHFKVTAGTLGGFVSRGGAAVFVLSNNHVLADEDRAAAGDAVLQRATFDGGRNPRDFVATVRHWVRLKGRGANIADAALARLESPIKHDAARLRGLVGGMDRTLAGVRAEPLDEGGIVYKIGRTTGATAGRVTAVEMDNVVVNYDMGNLRFDDQIEIEGAGTAAFSDGGDSGSLIVDSSMRAVALLFAGGDTGGSNQMGLTYANPIGKVLSLLQATLLF